MKIKFLETRVVQDQHAGTHAQTEFRQGKAYDLPELSCRHWVTRGYAEEVMTADQKRAAARAAKDAATPVAEPAPEELPV